MSDAIYGRCRSPVGELVVAATRAGVCLVAFEDDGAALGRVARSAGGVTSSPGALTPVFEELERYFAGDLRAFETPVDLRLASAFGRRVLERLHRQPFGELITYGGLARAVGTSSRAVGGAVGANPVPILVPCHGWWPRTAPSGASGVACTASARCSRSRGSRAC